MQNQMEEEDTDGESGSGDESDEGSEEEELPLLDAWNQDFTNSMNVTMAMILPGNITRTTWPKVLDIRTSNI